MDFQKNFIPDQGCLYFVYAFHTSRISRDMYLTYHLWYFWFSDKTTLQRRLAPIHFWHYWCQEFTLPSHLSVFRHLLSKMARSYNTENSPSQATLLNTSNDQLLEVEPSAHLQTCIPQVRSPWNKLDPSYECLIIGQEKGPVCPWWSRRSRHFLHLAQIWHRWNPVIWSEVDVR